MKDLLLCKPGEIFLKGLNKHYFEERLVANVKRRLKPIGHFRVTYLQSALYIEAADDAADLDAAYDAVRKVFGIATITRAAACEKDKDAITALAKSYLHDAMTAAHSFKVETKRSDKRFPMTSIELSQYVGGELAEAFPNTAVDVHDPELTVRLEVREQAAYVHAQAVEAAGGMPVGCNGAAVTLLSGGIDSPVSSYMIAKRGVRLVPRALFLLPVHVGARQGEGPLAGQRAHGLHRPHDAADCALHAHPGGDPPRLPGGILHAHHAPVHDAHRRGHRRAQRVQGHRHR